MSATTTKPVRTLSDIAGSNGVFSIIAMDQRNTLRRMFSTVGIEATDDDLVQSKTDVARALTPLASGILFDPTYGVPAVTGNGALAETCGLLVASEPAVRGKHGVEPITHRDPNLDARWVLDQGGDANKFFAQLRPDRPAPAPGEPDLVEMCLQAVRDVVADCAAIGVPSVIENLVYPFEGEDFTGKRR
jgi:tagatose-1,6-bisphosphate aldolase